MTGNAISSDKSMPTDDHAHRIADWFNSSDDSLPRPPDDGAQVPSRRRRSSGADAYLPAPPHLPVFTLKFPQAIGLRQSAIRSREPSRYGDHSWATIVPGVW